MTYAHSGQVHHMVHFDKHMSLGFVVRPWFCQIYTMMNYILGFKEPMHEMYSKYVDTNLRVLVYGE